MTEALKLTIDRRDALAVIQTEGYINNQGGEEIARAAYELLESGYTRLLLDLTGTKIINSIGISILIEIIEKMIEVEGKLAFAVVGGKLKMTHVDDVAEPVADAAE